MREVLVDEEIKRMRNFFPQISAEGGLRATAARSPVIANMTTAETASKSSPQPTTGLSSKPRSQLTDYKKDFITKNKQMLIPFN